jgi:hypothetical protein
MLTMATSVPANTEVVKPRIHGDIDRECFLQNFILLLRGSSSHGTTASFAFDFSNLHLKGSDILSAELYLESESESPVRWQVALVSALLMFFIGWLPAIQVQFIKRNRSTLRFESHL